MLETNGMYALWVGNDKQSEFDFPAKHRDYRI